MLLVDGIMNVIHQNPTYVAPPVTQVYVPPTRHQTYRPVQPEFGSFSHVDELASRLETLATEFCLDLHYNYSHNPGVPGNVPRGVIRFCKWQNTSMRPEHQHDRAAIQQQLGGLDQTFHHVRDDVRGWSRHHHRQVGQLGILAKMDGIESSLHHLMNERWCTSNTSSASAGTIGVGTAFARCSTDAYSGKWRNPISSSHNDSSSGNHSVTAPSSTTQAFPKSGPT